jgi:adenine-specific DNA-methyltransferase
MRIFMDKLDMQTPDLTDKNIKKLQELWPEVVTEKEGEDGATTRSVDFDLLRQLLSDSLVEGADERYRLDWPGKRRSLLKANTPITKTLRPVREESVDFDTTQNLFIEGDNFEALKILQESYLGKVKMIYIDPPYNTGKDFVYSDNFTQDKADYEEEIEAVDAEGNKMFKENTRTNPRFHSDWLSMMYERLTIARDLLKDDGVIFISIDDNEVHNLRKVCDEIFGESNFVSEFIWKNKRGGGNDSRFIAVENEYILFYGKSIEMLNNLYHKYSDEYAQRYKEIDNTGRFFWDTFKRKSGKQYYGIACPDGTVLENDEFGNPISWLRSEARFLKDLEAGEVKIVKVGSEWSVQFKQRMPEGKKPRSILDTYGTTSSGSEECFELFKKHIFQNPKPSTLVQHFIDVVTKEDGLILDFFSGSATTAHAVMQQNAEDGGNRKFIMVQLPEETPEGSEASKAGYKNIAQLGRERIRRAAAKIKADYAEKLAERVTPLDTGFRAYTVADTAFLDVERHPAELEQGQLLELADNIKADRTPADLLTQVMLELGLTLDLPIETKQVGNNTVFYVAHNALVACFDEQVPLALIDEMVTVQPLQVVFKDASFGSDDALINAETHLKRLSPDTILSVI